MSPHKVVLGSDGRITHLVLARNEQSDDGKWTIDTEQTMKKKCDFVISAFGSGLYSKDIKHALAPVKLTGWGTPDVNVNTMETSEEGVFCGGGKCEIRLNGRRNFKSLLFCRSRRNCRDRRRSRQRRQDCSLVHPLLSSGPERQVRAERTRVAQVSHPDRRCRRQRGDVRAQVPEPLRVGLSATGNHVAHDKKRIRRRMGIRRHKDFQAQ